MRYLSRNPYLGAGVAALDISDHGQPSARMFPLTRPQAWREARTQLRQQRYRENNLDRVEYVGGYFTAASGGTIYQGDQFPEQYRGNLFTGDVSGNLVHRDVLEAVGTSFIARRAAEERDREFLASTDPWFRPCNFATGPDGNLYVVDMYREFIEGPEFIPEELRKGMDFYSGDTLGRIYRIVPKNAPPTRSVRPNLGKADSSQLVAALSHPNGWRRLTAQRLLLERQGSSVIPLLKSKVTGDTSGVGRLHALYVLEGLSALDASLVESALHDTEPGVREHAVRLAEKFPQDHVRLAEMVGDSSAAVQFQLALSLGEVSADIAVMPLAKLALKHAEDPWFHTAILSSDAGSSIRLLQEMTRDRSFSQRTSLAKFFGELAAVIGARSLSDEISGLVRLMAGVRSLRSDEFQAAGLEGLARGLKLAGTNRLKIPQAQALLDSAMQSPSESVQMAARSAARYFELPTLVNRAKREALDRGLPPARREMAILTLGGGRLTEVRPVIDELLASPLDLRLLKATFQCLSGFDDPGVAQMVVTRWKNLGPSVRGDGLDVLLNQAQRVPALLTALENGQIERSALDLARREKLLHHPDSEINRRARRLLQEESSDRARLVTTYSAALGQKGDPPKGKTLFDKHCASCHRVRDGHRIGPDLSGVSSNTKAQLLQSILDPSKTIDPHYINYFVISKDGRIHDGLIVAETPGTLTLRRAEGEDETILRSRITGMRASMVSLMPEGFEKDFSPSAMANLIAFLQGGVSR
jgi:putative heme-binding domain-containing protein